MPDNLAELGRDFGRYNRRLEDIKRRGGMLPAIDRTRGAASPGSAYVASFVINEQNRKVAARLHLSKLPEPQC